MVITNKFYKSFSSQELIARPFYEYCYDIIKEINAVSKITLVSENNFKELYSPYSVQYNTLNIDNILLIPLESFDYNFLHVNNEHIPQCVSPTMDKLSKEFLSFTNFYTANQPTPYGIHALLSSRLILDKVAAPQTLFSSLKEKGFYTAIVGGAQGYYGNKAREFKRLYNPDYIYFAEDFSRDLHKRFDGWGVPVNYLFEKALQIMETHKKNFILLENIDTHPPYKTLLDEQDPCFHNQLVQNYRSLNCFAFLDREIAAFLSRVKNSKFWKNTLIIITADHSATHGENFTARKQFLPDRIPLIFIYHDLSKLPNFDRNKLYSQIDFPCTLLKMLDSKIPETFMGKDFLSKQEDFALSFIHPHHLRVRYSDNTTKIFDLGEENDYTTWYKSYLLDH